jgi:hypothetical protein
VARSSLDNALVMASSESPVISDRPQLSLVFTTPSTPTLLGDFNNDGLVGTADLGILQSYFGTLSGATPLQGDMNGDGMVNRSDAAAFALQFGKSSSLAGSPSASSAAAGAIVAAARHDAALGESNRDASDLMRARRAQTHRRSTSIASIDATHRDAAYRDSTWTDFLSVRRLARRTIY